MSDLTLTINPPPFGALSFPTLGKEENEMFHDADGIELESGMARCEWASRLRARDAAQDRLTDVARRTARLAPDARRALLAPEHARVERAIAAARAAEAVYDALLRAEGRTPLGTAAGRA